MTALQPVEHFKLYASKLSNLILSQNWQGVEALAYELRDCWETGRQIFFAGNGGSAGNANHVVNDFIYPVSKTMASGIRAHSLSINPSVISCLGNDEGYDNIFSYQLAVMARAGDSLVVFSGSGNSPNILSVLEHAKAMGVKTFAVVGFSGGRAKELADVAIHFDIDDMQISEDMQTIICHMIVQWLYAQRAEVISK